MLRGLILVVLSGIPLIHTEIHVNNSQMLTEQLVVVT
jgi:hypothetical protein